MQSEELSPEELSALLTSYMPDIPGYRVIRRIGKGGMSYVYLGIQVSLDRQVAIKVMQPEALTDEKSKQRFEQEAHTIAKLEHPCIVERRLPDPAMGLRQLRGERWGRIGRARVDDRPG